MLPSDFKRRRARDVRDLIMPGFRARGWTRAGDDILVEGEALIAVVRGHRSAPLAASAPASEIGKWLAALPALVASDDAAARAVEGRKHEG